MRKVNFVYLHVSRSNTSGGLLIDVFLLSVWKSFVPKDECLLCHWYSQTAHSEQRLLISILLSLTFCTIQCISACSTAIRFRFASLNVSSFSVNKLINIFYYLLAAFGEKLVHDLQYQPGLEHITETQAIYLRERLRGLYSYLKNHPALMDRRLQVASRKPLYTFRPVPVVRHFRQIYIYISSFCTSLPANMHFDQLLWYVPPWR